MIDIRHLVMMTLDPVHIGLGGYSLGRVDNAIVREPGTNLPKIPGTSLIGAARNYAAMRYGKPSAAGLHKEFKGGVEQCPIIYTFGTASESGGGRAGTVSISDAQLLFFPVSSSAGPVWVSTRRTLEAAGFNVEEDDKNSTKNPTTLKLEKNGEKNGKKKNRKKNAINLGWLMVPVKQGLRITPPPGMEQAWSEINERIVMISPNLFSEVVNSNLEVRTSVAIDPETGTAEDGALFTYEAIPRATWLWCDLIENDYIQEFPRTEHQFDANLKKENGGEPLGETWNRPLHVARAGLALMKYLGVGGMSTAVLQGGCHLRPGG